jgi:enoyl-CoA hydratase/carnithine racemase
MISIQKKEGVALLRLARGVTNAFNLELVSAISDALHQVREDPAIRGLVLGSEQDKFFSIGFDIPELFRLARPEFETFYSRFNRLCLDLLTLPKPTIAAITGHAIAGGCVLVLCCDHRFIADGRKLIGLNELKLGVPVPFIADCILRQLVGVHDAQEVEEGGEFLPPKRAQDMGLVDKVLPLSGVTNMAVERCVALGAMPQAAFAMIKRNRVEPVEEQVATKLDERERYFVDCWYAEDTRGRLEAAMQKF